VEGAKAVEIEVEIDNKELELFNREKEKIFNSLNLKLKNL
jgi:hypothetical protein